MQNRHIVGLGNLTLFNAIARLYAQSTVFTASKKLENQTFIWWLKMERLELKSLKIGQLWLQIVLFFHPSSNRNEAPDENALA